MTAPASVAGILLTGGTSRRMGYDKASLSVGGQPMAERLAALLSEVLDGPLVEIGPGRSGLSAVPDDEPGAGPLVAVASGARALGDRGWAGPAVVLACDLPLLSAPALGLVAQWPGDGAAVPVVGGRRQPLCARWSSADLAAAVRLAAAGRRSLHGLPGAGPCDLLTEAVWASSVPPQTFADVDSPEDLAALGLAAGLGPAGRLEAAGRGAP